MTAPQPLGPLAAVPANAPLQDPAVAALFTGLLGSLRAWSQRVATLINGSAPTTQNFSGTSGTMISQGTALVANAASAFALTLPTSVQITAGQTVTVKKTDTGAGAITVTPPSGQIDGSATATISGGGRNKNTFLWDGANWWITV